MKIGPDDQMDEAISALIDGELDGESDFELRQQLVERICADPELKARWTHFHLISDSLTNNLPSEIYCNFSEHVMQALDSEPEYAIPDDLVATVNSAPSTVIDASKRFNRNANGQAVPLSRRQMLMKRAAGFAIAASVASVALVSYQIGLQQHMDENLVAQQQSQQEFASLNPTQMATVNGVTVLASPVSNPQSQYSFHPSNTAPGVYAPPGQFSSEKNSRISIGYNVFDQRNNGMRPLDSISTGQQRLNQAIENGVQKRTIADERERALQLHQYLMDHNQRYPGSRVQGVMPYARIMAVPTTQPGNSDGQSSLNQ